MTQEEKDLLQIDLSARTPHGIKGEYGGKIIDIIAVNFHGEVYPDGVNYTLPLDEVKPYLRPMSSMTEEEKSYVQRCIDIVEAENYGDSYSPAAYEAMSDFTNYCYERHLDLNGLIPECLALEAPEGMYKIE